MNTICLLMQKYVQEKKADERPKTKRFYHGTAAKNLDSILQHGLDPEFAGTGADKGVPTDIPGYERRIFLATHPQINSGYGDARIEVELPEDFDVKPLFPWPVSSVLDDHYTTQKIPPKYLRLIREAAQAQAQQQKQADDVSPRVVPKIPLLNTPEATNAAMKNWTRQNYSGMFGIGPNRENFYKQIHSHIAPRGNRSFVGDMLGFRAKNAPNFVPQYTELLNKRFADQLGQVSPAPIVKTPADKFTTDAWATIGRPASGRGTMNLPDNPNSQYMGQNQIEVFGKKEDLFDWGPAVPRGLTGLHERQHLQQDLVPPETRNAAGLEKSPINLSSLFGGGSEEFFYEPAAVYTEYAHAADAARTASGKPVQGDATFAPGYTMPIDEVRREAERAGVLSGKRTAQDALNTPAGQAWLRMVLEKHQPQQEKQNSAVQLPTKSAELAPDVQLQEHQQRIADRALEEDPKLLVYHGLGSGKSLSAIAAAEMARRNSERQYGIVVPASLKGNFQKEIKKFTRNSNPEIMSYTGLALGKKFQEQPETLVMDEAHRLRNPESASTQAARELARNAKRVLLLTGSPITNSPTELASLISLLNDKPISPETFEKRYIDYKKVSPGWINWLRGIKPGEKPVVKNEAELRQLLQGKVDYHPSKTPEGVNVKEEVIRVPLSRDQQKIQTAIRTKIPPGFLWKLDQEFPLSRDELSRMNSFLNGLRQVSLSTQPFRGDKDPAKAFDQSAKLQTAMKNLQKVLGEDPRKKAIIYSNFIDSGINPYSAALEKAKVPHGIFHGGIPVKQRLQALKDYNEGKLRALLLGPAAAEGISTKGTSLIQLLDPHWHESRSQQARGRGLRFDSHKDLPEELKNVAVQRYISSSQDPSWLGKLLGYQRERTGDEILEKLTADKELLNEEFRRILREVGSEKKSNMSAKKKKREPTQTTPFFVPALGGLGALSLGAAYGLGSDKHMNELDQALKLEDTPLSDNETAMTRYADVMAVGARSTPFGVPVGKILSAVRGNPALMKRLGIEGYDAAGPGRQAEAATHYDLFSRGPIAAYHHMLTEARPMHALTPGGVAFMNSQQEPAAMPRDKWHYAESYEPRFMAAYRKWMEKQKGEGGLMQGGSGWIQPKDIVLRDVPHEKQVEFLRDYVGSLPKELREDETRAHEPSLNNNKKHYLAIFRNVSGARKLMKELGVGLGGAAGGGLVGHLLYRNLVNKKKQTTLGNYLATLAGSGVGGGAGYLFGSQHGQELLTRLMAGAAAKKPSA